MRNIFIKPYVFCQTYLRQFIKDTRGATLVEYVVLIGVVVGLGAVLKEPLKTFITNSVNSIPAITASTSGSGTADTADTADTAGTAGTGRTL
ncbi:hypothetical protein CJJ18_01300 [Candidatus Williamhamiltonella defendens]|uniref:Flp family type IVb pilin n=1 Tax=Candidatus Williamhamiltonella defendens TaxID=138072 RepID=A0AAC9YF60_9ENTR|nr:hypothetical protein [Candidatus Hamiltonella defensa]ASV32985.1 hypothetical protein CJJ18_01300 [Candidatus Hamiltonella defensa]AWK15939.1 hypothetical protein CCS40_01290 [Candidatus Hamiltonella defensa]